MDGRVLTNSRGVLIPVKFPATSSVVDTDKCSVEPRICLTYRRSEGLEGVLRASRVSGSRGRFEPRKALGVFLGVMCALWDVRVYFQV